MKKSAIYGTAIVVLIIILVTAYLEHNKKPDPFTNLIDCTQHVIIDGFPYCGVILVHGVLYEVTMDDIKNSMLMQDMK